MDAGSTVFDLVVSRDGNWVAGGMRDGHVVVWKATSLTKEIEFQGHSEPVYAVDISPDSARITSGSRDWTVSIWSLSSGRQLLGPLKHDFEVAGVRFSPDGKLIATATWALESVRIYDSLDGTLLANFKIRVNSLFNRSLAWSGNGKQLYTLSREGNVHCLDVSSKTALLQWSIHNKNSPCCIALGCDDTFLAVSANSSVSFWDTTTHRRIGPIIDYPHLVWSMAISENHDMVATGQKTITLRNLLSVLSQPHHEDVSICVFEMNVSTLSTVTDV